MVGTCAHLGEPAAATRIDLTLGVDADNDGLPDDWERMLTDRLGGTLADIKPGDDSDGDGIRNLDEYLAGTFAFEPEDGFRLNLVSRPDAFPLLEFMAVQSRTYTLYASPDVASWTKVSFRVAEDVPGASPRLDYSAPDTRILQVEPVLPPELPASNCFFKVMVQ